jgi:hypothetical protein
MVAQGWSTGAIGRFLPIPHHCALAGHLMHSIGPGIVCLFGAVSQITSVVYRYCVRRFPRRIFLPIPPSGVRPDGWPRQGATSYLPFQITPSYPGPNEPIKEANHALNHRRAPILIEIIGLEPSTTFWSRQSGNARLHQQQGFSPIQRDQAGANRGGLRFCYLLRPGRSKNENQAASRGKELGCQTTGAGCILICVQDGAIKAVLILFDGIGIRRPTGACPAQTEAHRVVRRAPPVAWR